MWYFIVVKRCSFSSYALIKMATATLFIQLRSKYADIFYIKPNLHKLHKKNKHLEMLSSARSDTCSFDNTTQSECQP